MMEIYVEHDLPSPVELPIQVLPNVKVHKYGDRTRVTCTIADSISEEAMAEVTQIIGSHLTSVLKPEMNAAAIGDIPEDVALLKQLVHPNYIDVHIQGSYSSKSYEAEGLNVCLGWSGVRVSGPLQIEDTVKNVGPYVKNILIDVLAPVMSAATRKAILVGDLNFKTLRLAIVYGETPEAVLASFLE